jgi:hypothetical protein
LQEQQASLESARARATTLFAANSLVAGFLVGRAVDAVHYDTGWRDWLGIAAVVLGVLVFVAAMAALLYVLWPPPMEVQRLPGRSRGLGIERHRRSRGSRIAGASAWHAHPDQRRPSAADVTGVRLAVVGTAGSTVLWLIALFVVKD